MKPTKKLHKTGGNKSAGKVKSRIFILVGVAFLFLVFIAVILTPVQKKAPVKAKKPPPPLVRPVERGRIAIVIDDWGYSFNNLQILAQIKQPLTCAVLPGLKNSNLIMQKLDNAGCEIILHLPMEPKEKYNLEKDTITLRMDASKIKKILDKDLSSVSLAKGISNHMGSRLTEDKQASSLVMAETKRRQLYFFDSFVTSKSVCPELAEKINVRFAKRDIFIDNHPDPAYIKSQLLKLKKIASQKGVAIGIGHDRRNTLLVLKEMLPLLQAQGYKFVFLSQVVE